MNSYGNHYILLQYDDSQGENNLSEQSSKAIIVDQADANPQPKQKVEVSKCSFQLNKSLLHMPYSVLRFQ